MTRFLGIAIESVATCAIIAGLCLETILKADVGFVVITAGAVGVAVGAMVYAKIWKWRG